MKILVLGSGGREHAMAWALEQSAARYGDTVLVAPGNGGTRARRQVDVCDPAQVTALCAAEKIDLVLVGPESALEAGVSDALRGAGLKVFGPSRAAARLETSKGFCREFAKKLGLPSPRSANFSGPGAAEEAKTWAAAQDFEVVVKADGLASGKGVVVPENAAERDSAIERLAKSGPIVLEEKLSGPEVSLLVFTDGRSVVAMPPAQDHKRIGEGDSGPNTGGMGVYAPTRICPPAMVKQILETIVRPTIDGLAREGTPYVGVLYAGLMMTKDGPKLLEYNCRFGDPEAQTLLSLLDTDLREIALACVGGKLAETPVRWRDQTACTVVLAARGYPEKPVVGDTIAGLDRAAEVGDVRIFHAGTADKNGAIVTSGGRVLNVTATGKNLEEARERSYRAARMIEFEGRQMRRDIGWRELARATGGYAASGVDIDEGNRAVELLKKKVEATHSSGVLGGIGSFGGALDASALKKFDHPVLVATTDGVGTKVMLASAAGRYDSIGHDIVNHCINDLLVQGARPLFFLDYIASSAISAPRIAEIVGGMADACAASGCILLGGETAEMPGVYCLGEFDVAGTMVGAVEKSDLLPRPGIAPGDVLLGLASSGPHTNGYSLARKIFRGLPLDATPAGLERTIGEALLAPHRSYLNVLRAALDKKLIKGLAHITGGGIFDNLPRVLPKGTGADIESKSWPVPPLFALIREASGLSDTELFRTFNMGIGMVMVCDPADESAVRAAIGEPVFAIGRVTAGNGGVRLI
ncbi:MAG: phosphoribosylamine--glycine ligase [Chthoniobacterales bacterium]|nr:phosphoribosylamine--glycine ligase [Chthoniobacterales bacterium]